MKANDTEIVERLLRLLTSEVGQERFELWFGQGVCFYVADLRLRVAAASQFSLHGLQKYFQRELHSVATQLLGPEAGIEFSLEPALVRFSYLAPAEVVAEASVAPPAAQEPRLPQAPEQRLLVAEKRATVPSFAAFVVGEENRLAFAAAQMACENPGSVSPLLLHGPAGVGKTHLLHALCGAVRKQRGPRVLHVSAENFTSDFVAAVRGAGLPGFRRKYREVGLLAIDDVQFFADKKATLGELAATLDAFQRTGKQLAFTADRAPAELAMLGAEITARLGGGLTCEVAPVSGAPRVELVLALARRLELPLAREVAEFLAERLPGDVRRLQGALHRLQACHRLGHSVGNIPWVRQALADLLIDGTRPTGLNDVERVVCESFHIAPADLRSDARSERLRVPRMLAMWLARKHTGAALAEISRHFGRRSHSTVLAAELKVNGWLSSEAPLRLSDRECAASEAVRRLETRLRFG